MDYVIECRPSPILIKALRASGAKELSSFLGRIIYFARGFSCPDGPSAKELSAGVREDILEASRTLPEGISFDVEHVRVSQGSVIILIFATVAIASHTGGGAAAAGGALHGSGVLAWAGSTLAGGALGVLGKKITEKLLGRIRSWFKRKGRVEPTIDVIDPQKIADAEAQKLTGFYPQCRQFSFEFMQPLVKVVARVDLTFGATGVRMIDREVTSSTVLEPLT